MEKIKRLLYNEKVSILKRALGESSKLHLVGGCVRDTLLSIRPKDLDFATIFTPDEVIQKLNQVEIPYVITGIRRGTVTAIVDKEPVEITTFRNPEDETEFVNSIETDLGARDFTINAIAINAFTGQVIDPYKGLIDLETNLLKSVRNPKERFTSDSHRILRLLRFGPGHGRGVDQNTLKAAKELVDLTKSIAAERIHDELIKIVCSKHADEAFRMMHSIGLLKIILPELEKAVGMTQNKYHKYDVFEHILHTIVNTPPTKIIRMTALLHDIGKPNVKSIDPVTGEGHFYQHEREGEVVAKTILERLRFSNEDTKQITTLVRKHGFDMVNCGRPAIRRLIRDIGKENIENLILLKLADLQAGHVVDLDVATNELEEFKQKVADMEVKQEEFLKLNITGYDVMEIFNLKEGPEVGKLLKIAKDTVLEDPCLNNKESLIAILKNNYS